MTLCIKGLEHLESKVKLSPPRGRPLKNSMTKSWDLHVLFSLVIVSVRRVNRQVIMCGGMVFGVLPMLGARDFGYCFAPTSVISRHELGFVLDDLATAAEN